MCFSKSKLFVFLWMEQICNRPTNQSLVKKQNLFKCNYNQVIHFTIEGDLHITENYGTEVKYWSLQVLSEKKLILGLCMNPLLNQI